MQFLSKVLPVAMFTLAAFSLDAQTLIEKADKQYDMHAFKAAADGYEVILARDADEYPVAIKLADTYYHLNDLAKAAKWYSYAEKGTALTPKAILNYGKILMMQGKYDFAVVQFQKYRTTDGTTADHYIKSCLFALQPSDVQTDLTVKSVAKINSVSSDFAPTIVGDKLIWSSARTDIRRGDMAKAIPSTQPNQLFTTPIDGVSKLSTGVSFFKSDFKNVFNESNVTFSPDGKQVAFMRNNFNDGARMSAESGWEMSLYTANVDANGNWLDIKPFPYNGLGYSSGFPSFGADGNTLYFASNRAGGQGGFDIYASQKRSSGWGEPRNMGGSINTPGDEITPFSDGKAFYFASDYHLGYGGFDLFKMETMNAEVSNMGIGINSSSDDYGLVYDPSVKIGFFVSNRGGSKGKEDIYRFEKPFESANIVVLNNGTPVKDAKVTVTQGNGSNLKKLPSGNYLLDLNDNKTYALEVKREGFQTKTVMVEPEYIKKSRVVEVDLARDIPVEMSTKAVKPKFKGTVYDGVSERPLEGVLVRATDQETNAQMEAVTDKWGEFFFQLDKTANYLITYSKESYIIGKMQVLPADMKETKLKQYVMRPYALSEKEMVASVDKDFKRAPSAAPVPTDVPKIYNQVVTSKSPQRDPSLPPVYSIQLQVSNTENIVNYSKYDDLKGMGNIYSVPEDNKRKIRLGVYKTRSEVDSILKKIQVLDYKGVYVVEEKNEKAVDANMFKPLPKPLPMPKSAPKTTTSVPQKVAPKSAPQPKTTLNEVPTQYGTKPQPKAIVAEDKTYKVQIAAMKKPEWFDDSKVSQLWKVEQVKVGDNTIFIMDGIKTLAQAKDLKAKVKAAGYKDAKVVVKEGDKFKVVD
jgi:hypothetical protein